MNKPMKKFVVVLRESVTAGIAINTAVHLAAQLGTLVPELGGDDVSSADSILHSGLPVFPNVILRAPEADLTRLLSDARELTTKFPDLLILDYPEQGYTTSTDEDYRKVMSQASEQSIRYFGLLIFGSRKAVGKLTSSFRLW